MLTENADCSNFGLQKRNIINQMVMAVILSRGKMVHEKQGECLVIRDMDLEYVLLPLSTTRKLPSLTLDEQKKRIGVEPEVLFRFESGPLANFLDLVITKIPSANIEAFEGMPELLRCAGYVATYGKVSKARSYYDRGRFFTFDDLLWLEDLSEWIFFGGQSEGQERFSNSDLIEAITNPDVLFQRDSGRIRFVNLLLEQSLFPSCHLVILIISALLIRHGRVDQKETLTKEEISKLVCAFDKFDFWAIFEDPTHRPNILDHHPIVRIIGKVLRSLYSRD